MGKKYSESKSKNKQRTSRDTTSISSSEVSKAGVEEKRAMNVRYRAERRLGRSSRRSSESSETRWKRLKRHEKWMQEISDSDEELMLIRYRRGLAGRDERKDIMKRDGRTVVHRNISEEEDASGDSQEKRYKTKQRIKKKYAHIGSRKGDDERLLEDLRRDDSSEEGILRDSIESKKYSRDRNRDRVKHRTESKYENLRFRYEEPKNEEKYRDRSLKEAKYKAKKRERQRRHESESEVEKERDEKYRAFREEKYRKDDRYRMRSDSYQRERSEKYKQSVVETPREGKDRRQSERGDVKRVEKYGGDEKERRSERHRQRRSVEQHSKYKAVDIEDDHYKDAKRCSATLSYRERSDIDRDDSKTSYDEETSIFDEEKISNDEKLKVADPRFNDWEKKNMKEDSEDNPDRSEWDAFTFYPNNIERDREYIGIRADDLMSDEGWENTILDKKEYEETNRVLLNDMTDSDGNSVIVKKAEIKQAQDELLLKFQVVYRVTPRTDQVLKVVGNIKELGLGQMLESCPTLYDDPQQTYFEDLKESDTIRIYTVKPGTEIKYRYFVYDEENRKIVKTESFPDKWRTLRLPSSKGVWMQKDSKWQDRSRSTLEMENDDDDSM